MPGKYHRQGYRPWGLKESDMTKQLNSNTTTSDLNAVKKTKKGNGRENALGRQMLFWKGDRGRHL